MERKIKFNLKNISFYFLGFFILSLGVNLMLRSNLGAGPWDTVTANLHVLLSKQFSFITLGTVSFVISFTIMSVVLLYTRKWVLIGMIIPMFFVAFTIDLWDIVLLGDFEPQAIAFKITISIIGAVLIPLGLSFVIASNFPAFVFDEFTFMMMDITNIKSVTIIRLGIEALGVSLGILFGFLAGIQFGDVGIASIIVVIMLPPLLEFFLQKLGAINENTN